MSNYPIKVLVQAVTILKYKLDIKVLRCPRYYRHIILQYYWRILGMFLVMMCMHAISSPNLQEQCTIKN